jgi:tRNA threonylcarbamoyladenosine dehydratase
MTKVVEAVVKAEAEAEAKEADSPTPLGSRSFTGLERLYGALGATNIRAAHVMVVGIGGVGSWAVEALVRSGVGRITMVDMDHVSESNINRQVHATQSTLGQAKILAMQDRMMLINPDCQVVCIDDFVTPENWLTLVPLDVDVVIDACDQVTAKVAMAAWALRQKNAKSLFISVGAAGGKRLAHLVDIDDLSKTTHDPLLAQLRYRLRKEHNAPREGKNIGMHCIYSKEAVKQPGAAPKGELKYVPKGIDSSVEMTDNTLNCHGYGSVVTVTATFGQCAAGWALDKLANLDSLPRKMAKITL